MNLEEHLDDPDPVGQTVRHHLHHLLRVHQVDQAELHQVRVHQAEVAVQVVIEIEVIDQIAVIDQAEAEVHVLEKMNNVMIAELN
jgi:hypothetical protein